MTFKFSFGKKADEERTSIDILLNKRKVECIILLGDSILDSFYWIETHSCDVQHALIAMTDSKIPIINISLDDFDTESVIGGCAPNPLFVKARQTFNLHPYKYLDASDNMLKPIKVLSTMIMNSEMEICLQSRNPKKRNKNVINPTVILSLMMNNIRRNLKFGRSDLIIESMRNELFGENFEKIVKLLTHNLQLNVVIIIGFEPHESFNADELHFSRDDMLAVWNYCVCKILQIAENYECAVIDLSRTLNPFNRGHYGSTAIELSDLSQKFLIELIIEVLARFEFASNDFRDVADFNCATSASTKSSSPMSPQKSNANAHQNHTTSPTISKSKSPKASTNRKNSYFSSFGSSNNNNDTFAKTKSLIYYGIVKETLGINSSGSTNNNNNNATLLDIRTDINNKKYRSKYFSLIQNRGPQPSDMEDILADMLSDIAFDSNRD